MVEVSRGDVVVVAFPGDYGKPRPAIVVQSNEYAARFDSILLCPITSETTKDMALRVLLLPTADNGLERASSAMIEKTSAVARSRVTRVIGHIDVVTMRRIDISLSTIFGLR